MLLVNSWAMSLFAKEEKLLSLKRRLRWAAGDSFSSPSMQSKNSTDFKRIRKTIEAHKSHSTLLVPDPFLWCYYTSRHQRFVLFQIKHFSFLASPGKQAVLFSLNCNHISFGFACFVFIKRVFYYFFFFLPEFSYTTWYHIYFFFRIILLFLCFYIIF